MITIPLNLVLLLAIAGSVRDGVRRCRWWR
jgi:hypothetical protein